MKTENTMKIGLIHKDQFPAFKHFLVKRFGIADSYFSQKPCEIIDQDQDQDQVQFIVSEHWLSFKVPSTKILLQEILNAWLDGYSSNDTRLHDSK